MKSKHFFPLVFLILTTILIGPSTYAAGWTVFVNKNGIYKSFDENKDIVSTFKLTEKTPKGSFAYYRSCLGYLDGELLFYMTKDYSTIALNAFNNKVVFVMLSDDTKTILTQEDVDTYLSNYKYSDSEFVRNLNTAVSEKNIRKDFVEKSLGVKAINNTITDEEHGYVYTFTGGILSSYKSSDGLSDDAKKVKTDFPNIFNDIRFKATGLYGASTTRVLDYINGQCKYFMRIDIDFISKAKDPSINYNYALLYCILYEGMTLNEFNILVPNAELSSSVDNYIIMTCGSYIFTFKNKVLVKK